MKGLVARRIGFAFLLIGIVGFSLIYMFAMGGGSRTGDDSNQNLGLSTGSEAINVKSSGVENYLRTPASLSASRIVANNALAGSVFYGPLGGENHAWMSYFAVNFDHSYAYVGDNVYIDVTAYNNDAGILGANLYVKYIYKDKNGVVTLTESSAEHNVPRGSSYAFPRVTKTLGGSTLPWTGGGAQDKIQVELWWDNSGTHRLQQDGVYAQFPVLAHLYFHGVGGHGIDTNVPPDTCYDGVQCESMVWTDGGSTPVTVKGYLYDMYNSLHDSASQDFTINDNQYTWLFGPNLHVQNGGPKGQYHWYMEVYDKYTGLLEATTLNQYINPLYPPDYTVTWIIHSSPSGLIVRIDGPESQTPATCHWKVASTHTLDARDQSGGTGRRYVWTSWSDGLGQSHSVGPIPDAPDSRTANFKTQYYLTVSSAYDTPGGAGWYDAGSTAYATLSSGTVSGGAGTQYVFTSWGTDASGTNYAQSNPITMNSAKTATANWKTQHYLTVSSAYGSTGGQGWYDSGTNAYATVTPLTVSGGSGTQYVFTQWSGDASGSTSPSNAIYMNGPKTANANWKTQYQHTITSSLGTGSGYVTVDGSPVTTPYTTPWWDSGSAHTIAASSLVDIISGQNRYRYSSWSDSGAQSHGVSPTAPTTYTAYFQPQYYFGVSSAYGGPTGQGWYDSGSSVVSNVTRPVSGGTGVQYETTGWTGTGSLGSGGGSGSTSTYSFQITAYSTCTWNWKTQYYLTVISPYDSPTPVSGWFDSGTAIPMSLISPVPGPPSTQYVCIGWSGSGSVPPSGSFPPPPSSVTITMPSSITWIWKTQYQHTITSSLGTGSGYVTVDGSPVTTPYTTPWWDSGSTHTIAANSLVTTVPGQSQYVYSSWSDSGAQSHSVSPTAVTTYDANFQLQYYLSVSGGDGNGAGWYSSGTPASSTASYVLNQINGQSRNNLYQKTVDGTPTSLTRANSSTSIQSFNMSAYHNIVWSYNTQYYLTVTGGNSIGFGTASPTGDQWYDSGSSTTISSNWVWGTIEAQSRTVITNWQFDGSNQNPPRQGSGTLTTLSIYMSTHHTVNFVSTTQYFLTVSSGNGVTTSGSQTSDSWYDSGSSATATSNYVWNLVAGQSRNNLYRYNLDGGSWNAIARANTSTYTTPSIPMSTYHTVNFGDTVQYFLTVTGGNSIAYGTVSPTGDSWYDPGTSTTVSSNWVWNTVPGQSRTAVANYTIDGVGQNPPRQSSGTLTTSSIGMSTYRTVTFVSVTQYYLTVSTNPPSLNPPPIVSPLGYDSWYDSSTHVNCESQNVTGAEFGNWTVDGIGQGSGINLITVAMDGPHSAVANYRLMWFHDVAIVNATCSKTVVGQNYSTAVGIAIENRGNFTETFNVTAYANTTIIGSENVTLSAGNSTTFTFTWDTTGRAYGNYTVSAYAWPVQGETSTGDNTLSGGTVIISHVGDITGDGKCDTQDLARVSAAYGSLLVTDPLDLRYGQYWHPVTCPLPCPHTPNADITNDGIVDIQDLAITSANFGWHE